MRIIEEEFYAWCKDYLPEIEARGLSRLLAFTTKRKIRHYFGMGIFVGIVFTLVLLKWLS